MDSQSPHRRDSKLAEEEIASSLEELREITRLLSFRGARNGIMVLGHFMYCVICITSNTFVLLGLEVRVYILFVEFLLLMFSIFTLYRFDELRKRGDALYQEISDEVEWAPRQFRSKESELMTPSSPKEVPRLSIRIAFREFLLSANLPLVGGREGNKFYLGIHFGSAALLFFFFSTRWTHF